MRICVIGSGVIGTIYRHVFADAGHEVTHYVRPARGEILRHGVELNLLDAGTDRPVEVQSTYRPTVIEALDASRPFDLVLASVRHNQVPALLPVLASGAGKSEILFFNNLWTSFEPVDAALRGRYLWGFPVAGGGFDGSTLHAALLGEVQLGGPEGCGDDRLVPVQELFAGCGLQPQVETRMLDWLWTHFAIEAGVIATAIEAGVIATAIKAGGVSEFLGDLDRIAEAVLAVRDGLSVVNARGVDPQQRPDAQMFFAPELAVAQGIKDLYDVDRAARRIMERHTGREELKRIYHDVLQTGVDLHVDMPVLASLRPFVDAFPAEPAA